MHGGEHAGRVRHRISRSAPEKNVYAPSSAWIRWGRKRSTLWVVSIDSNGSEAGRTRSEGPSGPGSRGGGRCVCHHARGSRRRGSAGRSWASEGGEPGRSSGLAAAAGTLAGSRTPRLGRHDRPGCPGRRCADALVDVERSRPLPQTTRKYPTPHFIGQGRRARPAPRHPGVHAKVRHDLDELMSLLQRGDRLGVAEVEGDMISESTREGLAPEPSPRGRAR